MNRTDTLQHQHAFRTFANIGGWASPCAVTLTMKQGIMARSDHHCGFVKLTPQHASQNFRHFMSVLTRKVLGKSRWRKGKRLRVIPIIEGTSTKRLHYHAVIECPNAELLASFPSMVRAAWLGTQWGHEQTDIQLDVNQGWVNYMSKLSDKPSFADAIDWENCHLQDCRV